MAQIRSFTLNGKSPLQNLADAMAEEIIAMSDEELAEALAEQGTTIEAEAAKVQRVFKRGQTQDAFGQHDRRFLKSLVIEGDKK